jgi:hypothetical protein
MLVTGIRGIQDKKGGEKMKENREVIKKYRR